MISQQSDTKLETATMKLETHSLSSFDVFAYRPGSDNIYHPGDIATLIVQTIPAQSGQIVYRHRHFQKKGSPYWLNTLREIGRTDKYGKFVNSLKLPNDPSIFGTYRDKYCVGSPNGPCSSYLSFLVCPQEELQAETIPQETNPEVPEVL